MNGKNIALLVVGVILFAAGWAILLNGVEVKTCNTTLYVPRSFEGEFKLSYTEWIYWTNIPLNVSSFHIKGNETRTFKFTVNKSIGWIRIVIVGEPVEENYRGSLVIANASDPSQAFITLSLHPMQSIGGRGMNITSMFLQPLHPGAYLLSITLNTDANIHRISIDGPSATETERLAPKITFTPSTYDQITLSYTCGISFSYAVVAAIIMSVGMSVTVVSSIITQLQERLRVGVIARKLKKRIKKT